MSLLVPPYWQNETSGKLAIAVERFFQDPELLTSEDIENLKIYIMAWINSSAFESEEEREKLKTDLNDANSYDEIADITEILLSFGIDPF